MTTFRHTVIQVALSAIAGSGAIWLWPHPAAALLIIAAGLCLGLAVAALMMRSYL